MKTSKAKRAREAQRKAKRRAENKPRLRWLKQWEYFLRTGAWESDPSRLHWHHLDPSKKTRKICHLITRSWSRIMEEVDKCVVLHECEHLALHGASVLRTK